MTPLALLAAVAGCVPEGEELAAAPPLAVARPPRVVSRQGADGHHATLAWRPGGDGLAVSWTEERVRGRPSLLGALLDPDTDSGALAFLVGEGVASAKADLAVDPEGRLLAAYQTAGDGVWLGRWAVDDGGAGVVGEEARVQVADAHTAQGNSSVDLALAEGAPRLVWVDERDGRSVVRAVALDRDLAPVPGRAGFPDPLATAVRVLGTAPDVAADATGTVVAYTLEDLAIPDRLVVAPFPAGAPAGCSPRALEIWPAPPADGARRPTVALDGAGRTVVAWRLARGRQPVGARIRVIEPTGIPLGPSRAVPLAGADRPTLAVLDDGTVFVAVEAETEGRRGIYGWWLRLPNLATLAEPTRLSDPAVTAARPHVAVAPGTHRVAVSWERGREGAREVVVLVLDLYDGAHGAR